MYKEVLNSMNVTYMAEIGLVIFFLVFVGVTVWALTRERAKVARWGQIPLRDDAVDERKVD